MMEHLWLLLLGFAVGTLGTLIGAGGGFVLMPILLLCYRDSSPENLTATSLAVVFFNATSGSISYGRMKRIDYKSGLLFSLSGLPGVLLGVYAVEHIPRTTFNFVFGVLLMAASLLILLRPANPSRRTSEAGRGCQRIIVEADGTRHVFAFNIYLGMALSFIVGFCSTLLGIGGGIIHVPAMAYLLNFPVHVATATSHFILAVMAMVGTAVHVVHGSLGEWQRVAMLSVGAVAGAQLGARLSNLVHGRWIMRCLAAALGLVGGRILFLALWQ